MCFLIKLPYAHTTLDSPCIPNAITNAFNSVHLINYLPVICVWTLFVAIVLCAHSLSSVQKRQTSQFYLTSFGVISSEVNQLNERNQILFASNECYLYWHIYSMRNCIKWKTTTDQDYLHSEYLLNCIAFTN